MIEYGCVTKPTTDISSFDLGSCVYWLRYDVHPSYGFVIGKTSDLIKIGHFDGGFPWKVSRYPKGGSVRKTDLEEGLEYLKNLSQKFQDKMEGLVQLKGAIIAREKYYLDGIIDQLQNKKSEPYQAVTTTPKAPETGIYVVQGIYSGQGPSDHLELVHIKPRIREGLVWDLMLDQYPNGFQRIPGDIWNTPATSHGSLVGYRAYEIPEDAKRLVENFRPFEFEKTRTSLGAECLNLVSPS